MKLRPIDDTMILEIVPKQKSSLIMPDSYKPEQDESTLFIVKAIGPGHYDHGIFINPQVKVGDKIMIGAFAATKMEMDDKKVVVGRARDVIFVVED